MFFLEDYQIIKNGSHVIKVYRTYCDNCNVDRGYKRKRESKRLCAACSKRQNTPDNIDIRDFITKKYAKYSKRLYKTVCIECGGDKGYKAISFAAKLCHSCNMRKRWNTGGMSHCKVAKRKFEYQGIKDITIFKSSYELAYAKFLDSNGIKWEYEPIFKLSNGRSILPDFKLDTGVIIEIKGYWRLDAKEKWQLFCKDYPLIKKQVLMKNDLEQLGII